MGRWESIRFDSPVHGDQLREWNKAGIFTANIGDPSSFPAYASLDDLGASMYIRVQILSRCQLRELPQSDRFYSGKGRLKVWVATCIYPDGGQRPLAGDMGIPGSQIISPGKKETSVLWLRMKALREKAQLSAGLWSYR